MYLSPAFAPSGPERRAPYGALATHSSAQRSTYGVMMAATPPGPSYLMLRRLQHPSESAMGRSKRGYLDRWRLVCPTALRFWVPNPTFKVGLTNNADLEVNV